MRAHMFDWDMPFGGMQGFGIGGIFMWIFFLIIIVAIVYFVAKEINKKSTVSEPALDIIKKRYAKGEINKAEFEEIKKSL